MSNLTITRVTSDWLRSMRACDSAIAQFTADYPDGVDLTPEAITSAAGKYDMDWLAERVLTAPAWAEYERATAPAFIAAAWGIQETRA